MGGITASDEQIMKYVKSGINPENAARDGPNVYVQIINTLRPEGIIGSKAYAITINNEEVRAEPLDKNANFSKGTIDDLIEIGPKNKKRKYRFTPADAEDGSSYITIEEYSQDTDFVPKNPTTFQENVVFKEADKHEDTYKAIISVPGGETWELPVRQQAAIAWKYHKEAHKIAKDL